MTAIFITLGKNNSHNSIEFGIKDSDHSDCPDRLVIREWYHDRYEGLNTFDTDLGPATVEHFDRIISFMQQLRIHMTEPGEN